VVFSGIPFDTGHYVGLDPLTKQTYTYLEREMRSTSRWTQEKGTAGITTYVDVT